MARMERLQVATPAGQVSAAWHDGGARAPARRGAPRARARLGNPVIGGGGGAGGGGAPRAAGPGMDHPFIVGFCSELAREGVSSLRFNFPYMEAGKRTPDRAGNAIVAFGVAVEEARRRSGGLVFGGGKSYGGRMASMAAAEGLELAGLVFLGYPLHAPGRSDRPRDEHLYGLEVPMLFLQGAKDPFADPVVLASVLKRLGKRAVHVAFEGAGHSFEMSRKDDARAVGASLAPHVAAFMSGHI